MIAYCLALTFIIFFQCIHRHGKWSLCELFHCCRSICREIHTRCEITADRWYSVSHYTCGRNKFTVKFYRSGPNWCGRIIFAFRNYVIIDRLILKIRNLIFIQRKQLHILNKHSLPWDCNVLFGWIGEIIFSAIFGRLYFSIFVPIVTSFLTICLYQRAFAQHFEHLIQIDGKQQDIESTLIKSIDFHVRTRRYLLCDTYMCMYISWTSGFSNAFFIWFIDRRLFQDTSKVYGIYISYMMLTCIFVLACGIFQMDLVINSNQYSIWQKLLL